MLKRRVNLHGSAELSAAYIRVLPPDKIKYTRPPRCDITGLILAGADSGKYPSVLPALTQTRSVPAASAAPIPRGPCQAPRRCSWVEGGLCPRCSPSPSITLLSYHRLGAAGGVPVPYFPFSRASSEVSIVSAWGSAFNNLTSSTVFI